MKSIKSIAFVSSLLLLSLFLTSCVTESPPEQKKAQATSEQMQPQPSDSAEVVPPPPIPAAPATLPVRYQTASYLVDEEAQKDIAMPEESKLKVGARITSTRGPQPLWDIFKRLAALKGMNVSWASDVDRNVLVDVDINANDDFYEAIDNMLRQVDFFHEMQGNTIIVKYRETRQFQIAMPFVKSNYTTSTGGNVLGNSEISTNIDGTIELTSRDNEFDIWANIQSNLDTIMDVWSVRQGQVAAVQAAVADESATTAGVPPPAATTKGTSKGEAFYVIDKPIGLITVTAPRPLLVKMDEYFTSLKKHLYKQISIEAKIIEVQLREASSIGINWTNVLKDFNLRGLATFGTGGLLGQVYPSSAYRDDDFIADTTNSGNFVASISMAAASFDVFLNALNEEGDTKILSNPKLSVMNGQPALITVGRNVTYIDSITADRSTGNVGGDLITYTAETERILSGIAMALTATILGKDEIIMNLVPITSELEEPIEYRTLGSDGGEIGLPIVRVREMSTTVKVKDGEMLVIGGLISDVQDTKGEFAPILGDIPLLRYLFGYEEKEHLKRELIILLRPRII
ncbi:MAG: pilus (MSHA type) biogenesis protein MshL [Deltaproteobacteria bacterium]|nr:pilus (MSHA type) biogenesis protein MshL [Deltaproteobacteria bacterium]